MKKIETLFLRSYEVGLGGPKERRGQLVVPEIRPGCEWVFAGEGVATEKFDGTACAVIEGRLYKRRCINDNDRKPFPLGWIDCFGEGWTDSRPGWVPVRDGPEDRWHREAWANTRWAMQYEADREVGFLFGSHQDGTYELVGPRVQSNPYDLMEHQLWRHGSNRLKRLDDGLLLALRYISNTAELSFGGIQSFLSVTPVEGIVWHHHDGRMAKIKRRDFNLPWPLHKNRPKVSDAKLDAIVGDEP